MFKRFLILNGISHLSGRAALRLYIEFTWEGAQKVIDRFLDSGVLVRRDSKKTYEYRAYISLFQNGLK